MKHFLLLLFTLSAYTCLGQNFGSKFVSGHFNFTASSSKEDDILLQQSEQEVEISSFGLHGAFGKFLTPNLALGAIATYSITWRTSNSRYFSGREFFSEEDLTSHGVAIGPFVRRYFPLGDKAAFFGQATTLLQVSKFYIHTKTNLDNSDFDRQYSSVGGSMAVSPGFVFFPTQSLGLEVSLGSIGYEYRKSTYDNSREEEETTTTGFSSKLGLNGFTLGVAWYFDRQAPAQQ